MTFDEKDQGSLEVGKFADMVVLSDDIFTVKPERIRDLWIAQAIVGGEVAYSGTTAAKPWMQLGHPWTRYGQEPGRQTN